MSNPPVNLDPYDPLAAALARAAAVPPMSPSLIEQLDAQELLEPESGNIAAGKVDNGGAQ